MSEPHDVEPVPAANPMDDEQGIHAQLEALRQEAAEHYDKYIRMAAELDNFRKRSARELEQVRKYGAERLIQSILPVRDSLEAGIAAGSGGDPEAVLEGVRATLRLLDQALADAGVREIDPRGQPFDPTKHEALSMAPSPAEPQTVIEVVQKGYELNDRLLRAAKVVVSQGPASPA